MSDELKSNATEPMAEAAPAEAAPPTPAELAELCAKAAKADEHWDRLLRQAADFENFKKRAARDRQDALRYANEGLLAKLVPVLDNFEMAMAAAKRLGLRGVVVPTASAAEAAVVEEVEVIAVSHGGPGAHGEHAALMRLQHGVGDAVHDDAMHACRHQRIEQQR